MNQKQWLKCGDPIPMLEFIRGKAGDRKLRLFLAALMYRVMIAFDDKPSHQAIRIMDRFADRKLTWQEMDDKLGDLRQACTVFDVFGYPWASQSTLGRAAFEASKWLLHIQDHRFIFRESESEVSELLTEFEENSSVRIEARRICGMLHDIFGNPFRPVAFSSEWRTDTTLSLARQIHDSHDFGALPILADALQDAGCEDEDVLNHCRGEGPHVRGCWVVDLVLGKE